MSLGTRVDSDIEDAVYEECMIFSSYDDPVPAVLSEDEQKRFTTASRESQPAGIVATVVKIILHLSGAMDSGQMFEQLNIQRAGVANIEDQLIVTICRAFPAYTPETLDELDWPNILRRVAQAEALLMGYTLELPVQSTLEAGPGSPGGVVDPGKLDIEKMIEESQRELGIGSESEEEDQLLERQAEMHSMRERYLKDRFRRA